MNKTILLLTFLINVNSLSNYFNIILPAFKNICNFFTAHRIKHLCLNYKKFLNLKYVFKQSTHYRYPTHLNKQYYTRTFIKRFVILKMF